MSHAQKIYLDNLLARNLEEQQQLRFSGSPVDIERRAFLVWQEHVLLEKLQQEPLEFAGGES